jgi:hypothetical protein
MLRVWTHNSGRLSSVTCIAFFGTVICSTVRSHAQARRSGLVTSGLVKLEICMGKESISIELA